MQFHIKAATIGRSERGILLVLLPKYATQPLNDQTKERSSYYWTQLAPPPQQLFPISGPAFAHEQMFQTRLPFWHPLFLNLVDHTKQPRLPNQPLAVAA